MSKKQIKSDFEVSDNRLDSIKKFLNAKREYNGGETWFPIHVLNSRWEYLLKTGYNLSLIENTEYSSTDSLRKYHVILKLSKGNSDTFFKLPCDWTSMGGAHYYY